MDTTKVVIDNWPKTNRITMWIPIIVAMFSLIVSIVAAICSYNFAKKSFVNSHRPYVWAASYGVIDDSNKTIIPVPFKIAYRVKNAPARIIHQNVSITLRGQVLYAAPPENSIRFPDETSEWAFTFPEKKFQEVMRRSDEEKALLKRIIEFDYTDLDGGQRYHYRLQQKYVPDDDQWKDTDAEAS